VHTLQERKPRPQVGSVLSTAMPSILSCLCKVTERLW
jgi:hypothetical protein